MKILNRPIAIILGLLFIFSVAGASFASKADEMMADAAKAVAAAKASKQTADIDDNYQKAADLYTKVGKEYSDTPQGAEAYYRLAIVQSTPKTKLYNLYTAHETLKTLQNSYDLSVLKDKLSDADMKQLKVTLADSGKLKKELEVKLDHKNATEGYYSILYKIIDSLVKITGKKPGFSYWFAIVLLTVIIKLLTTPLTKKQFQAMKEMQTVAPLIKEIQEKYKGDQATIGQKTMDLYKEHNINPFASCLPLLIQMPIIMLLFWTMQAYEFQLQNGTFAWIGSAISHLSLIHIPFTGGTVWLSARNLAEPDLILVVLYLISMYVSTKMSAVDPSQAEQQKMMAILMPLMFGFIFASYPSAFLLYWLTLNVLQTGQQYLIMRAPATAPTASTEEPTTDDTQRVRRRRRR